jgi:hypothetical protein
MRRDIPFTDNLIDGKFRSSGEQRERSVVLAGDGTAVVYCGSGVTACHNALAIESVGLPLPCVSVGSWSGLSTDPHRHIVTGPNPRSADGQATYLSLLYWRDVSRNRREMPPKSTLTE